MKSSLFKTLLTMAIVSGVFLILWGIGGAVSANEAHKAVSGSLFMFRVMLGAGLIALGLLSWDFWPDFRRPSFSMPKADYRFYKALGRE